RLLRQVLAENASLRTHAMPAARLFLTTWLLISGRVPEAREQVRLLRSEFKISHFVVFDALILTQEAWVDALDGLHAEALARLRDALRLAADPLSEAITPHLPSVCLTVAAVALAGLDGGVRAVDAARCLGAAEALLPPGHLQVGLERTARDRSEARVRAALADDEAYESAYAEGGGLSPAEATALL
ncbi:AfsR family transcriptional regulator, partial [Streptomyces sp. NPDC059627]